MMDSATGDGFVNDKIRQRHLRAIDMHFYLVRTRVRQGQFMVYWLAGDYNVTNYFTKYHTINQHRSQRSIYIVLTADARKCVCYMSHIDL